MTHNLFRLGIIALVGMLLAASAHATPKNWATGDGNWSVDSNWSPIGVPVAADDANIVFADGVARTVTIDSTGPADFAISLTVDQTGAGSNASTLAITGNTLSDQGATIGHNGIGAVTQTGGIHNVSTNLIVGENASAVGTYTLSTGGTLNTTFGEYIGNQGTGTFTQTGGSHTANTLIIGFNPSSLGTYTLSGSSSSLQAVYETIGAGAKGNGTQSGGTFTQTAGSNQAAQLTMAQDLASTASYSLSGGTLSAQSETIASNGTANFNQTGGANSMFELDLGTGPSGNGVYAISGGGLHAGNASVGGNFLGAGGTGVMTISSSAVVTVDNSINVFNTPGSSLNLQGGTLTTSAINVHGVPSLFKWTSGTLNLTGDVTWDPAAGANTTSAIFGSNLNVSAGHTLNVTGNETIGGTGPFQLTMNGGTHTVSGDIILKPGGSFFGLSSQLTYSNFIQDGGTLTYGFTNNSTYLYRGGTINILSGGSFINNGTATFAGSATVNGTVQNNGTMVVNSGQSFAGSGGSTITNSGSFFLAGGSIVYPTIFTNAVGASLTAHGTFNTPFTNHGAFVLDGVLGISSVTNDGIIQGAGTFSYTSNSFINNNTGGVINATSPGAALVFTGNVNNNPGAVINVGPTSTLSIGAGTSSWINYGLVNLQGAGARLGGGSIQSPGTIQGYGTITSSTVSSIGIIRATGGELDFTAPGITNPSSGQIQAVAGSSVVFLQGMLSSSGMISLTGGTFDNAGHTLTNNGTINGFGAIRTSGLTNSSTKLLSVGEGNMDVFGNFTNNGVVNIQTGRSAYFYGTVNGNGSFTGGGTAVFLNSLSPGNSPALVTMSGSATLVGGTALAMELGGNTPGTQYDQFRVGGALSIGGILSLPLINGFMPAVGSSFDLLDWGTLTGTFSSLSLPTLATGQWDTSQLYTTGVLSVIPTALAGDNNNNGVVDAADYVAWRHGLGTTYTQNDYDVWRANFGNTAASGSGSQVASGQAQVPEPDTVLLGLLSLGCLAATGRDRSRI